tara:strand:- start:28 stop:1191 length:1164 start_codon:yes stop_codon:yes gene_type:complete
MVKEWLNKNFERVIEIRRWLHKHPEVGFNEYNTSNYCKKIMKKYGYRITQNKEMKTGFYCDYGSGSGPVLALRCDLDALPIEEVNNINYRSVNKGVSHACGHDSHMANILGLAIYISEKKIYIPGTIRFLFQPAEELAPGGAILMMNAGAIDNVNHIIGGHVLPSMKSSQIGIRFGAMAAFVEKLEINIKGPGGHTSRPAESVDLIWAQSHLVLSLEESIKHRLGQNEKVVLAFGKVVGGKTCNVLPSDMLLLGTLRYLNSNLKDKLYQIIDDTIKSVELITNAEITWHIPHSSPGLTNDENCTELVIDAAESIIGKENVLLMKDSSMGGEDFAYYLQKIPGAYFRIGCYDGQTRDIHTNDFNIDERCMKTAIMVFSEIINIYFSKK